MRSKNAVIILILLWAISFHSQLAMASSQPAITITVDSKLVKTEVSPIIRSGRTMVPLRAVGEALHLQVGWNPVNQTINLTGTGLNLILTIGNQNALLNNGPLQMEVPPFIVNGRTMVPLRFISEAIGCEVNWNEGKQLVAINSPPAPLKVIAFYALGNSENSSWNDLFNATYPDVSQGNTGIVNEVALGWYTLDQDGILSNQSQSGWSQPQGWEDVLQATKQFDLDTQMTVHMTDKNSAIMNLLTNEEAQDSAVISITQTAALYNGVNLDFEGLGWNDTGVDLIRVQELFSQFVNKLSLSLHQSDKTLALGLHPQNSSYLGYDYRILGTMADQIIIMAYDYGPKPEPLDKVKQAVTMAQLLVPSKNLYLGISVPSETPESMGEKITLASNSKLGGIAIWRLGLLTDSMWDQLKSNPRIENK
ncbi:MAG: stalk domain-containing protein [Methylocystaceae bacterium]